MYGSGVKIGIRVIVVIAKQILRVLYQALDTCFVEVVGAAARETAVYRFDTSSKHPIPGITTSDYVLPLMNKN